MAGTYCDTTGLEGLELAEMAGEYGGAPPPVVADNGGVFVLVRSILSVDPLMALEIRLDWS